MIIAFNTKIQIKITAMEKCSIVALKRQILKSPAG